MGITFVTAPAAPKVTDQTHTFDDVRALISELEEYYGPRLRGKLQTARELITEVENEAADQGLPL